jgi:predicted transcriptional regulator
MSFSVKLDEQTAAVVQELAANEKRSASEVIHDALVAYAAKRKRPLPKGVGKYRSGHHDTAQKVDEILGDAVKEGLWP